MTTTRYAALVLDLGLPDGEGLSILREIRQRKDPIPVLVLTARGGLHDRVTGLRSGADDYLVKPFALEEWWRGWKRYCAGLVSCSDARFKLQISHSTPKAGRHSSTTSRNFYPPARPRCSSS